MAIFDVKAFCPLGIRFPSNLEIFNAVKALQRKDKIISVNECIVIEEGELSKTMN